MSPSCATTGDALLLSDTSVLVAFCSVGAGEKLMAHLQGRVWVVDAVALELARKAATIPNLQRMLDQHDWPPVIELPATVKLEVADALSARAAPGRHPNEDEGEIATVLYADHARREGTGYQLLMDDRSDGKRLADHKGHVWTDTPGLLVEMVCAASIDIGTGQRVWAGSVSKNPNSLKAYRTRVKEACPELAGK